MRTIKQSTAYDLMVLMVDATDHVTGETGLTLTITASKAGAAFASITPTVTERGDGWYALALTTSHTDTLGELALHLTGSGAAPSDLALQVRAKVLGDTQPANILEVLGVAADPSTDFPTAVEIRVEMDTNSTKLADIPTNAELATALGTADDAVLAQVALVKAQTDLLPSDPADQSLIIAATDALATLIGDVPTNAELATALGTADDAILAQVALVKAKTDNLPSDPADQSLVIAATDALATLIGDVPTNAELATALATADDAVLAAIAALNNLSAAQVNAEVVDGLTTDTYAEPSGPPAATASLKDKIGWLAILARNTVTQTATQQKVRNDANAADVGTAAVSDDGTTFTRGEFA